MSVNGIIQRMGTKVTHQTPTYTVSATGHHHPTYATAATLTAFVQPGGSAEPSAAGGRRLEVTHTVFVTAGTDVSIDDRLLIGTRILRVVGVREAGELPVGHRLAHMILDCNEVAAGT